MSRTHYLLVATPWVLLLVFAALAVWTTPDPRGYGTHEQLGLGVCQFRDWLGAPCPTCGVTTSASHLAHGELRAAWMTQPLGVLLGASAVAGVPLTLVFQSRRVDLGQWFLRYGARVWATIAVTVAACWLL
jgi:hypothetical protein